MPLSELSINHVGENGTAMGPSANSSGELIHPKPSDVGGQSSLLQGPSSIQSMLKNSTETGDVGQFSIRPPRVPQSVQRTSLHPHGIQPSTTRRQFARQHHVNYGETHQSTSPFYASSTASSGVVSLHKTKSQRSYRAPSQASANEDERQRMNGQNASTDRSLSHSTPHATNRPQGLMDPRGVRPRSPFAYPTRLKRPGYRPSSPAFSDLNRSIHGTTMSGYRDDPPRTSSPLVTYSARKALSTRHYGYSQPETSFRRYLPSPMTSHNSTRASSPLSTREPTPGPPLSFDQTFFESRESLAPNSAHSGWSRNSLSPSPVFYDYTEAFEENHLRTSTVSLAKQVILENPNMVYRGHRSATSLSGMPANSENSSKSPHESTQDTSMYSSPSNIHRRLSGNAFQYRTAKNNDFAVQAGLASDESLSLRNPNQFRRSTNLFSSEEPLVDGVVEDHDATLDDTRIYQPTPAITDLVANDSDISLASVSRSLSPKESMYSVRSSPNLEKSNPSSPVETLAKTQPKEPAATSSRSDLASETADMKPRQPSLGAKSCDRWSESECSQIYAPTPERSMSSPSHRDRFSRIFSIGEGPLEADEADLAQNLESTGFITIGETDGNWSGHPGTVEAPYCRLENLPNTLPRKSRDPLEIVFRSKSEYGTESTNIPRDGPDKNEAISSRNHLLSKLSSEQINTDSEAQTLPRLAVMRKPALSLSVSPAHPFTEDQVYLNRLSTGSDIIPAIPSLEGSADRQRPVAQLSSMPSLISFRSCSPPIDLKSAGLPFSFTPLLPSEEDDREADLPGGPNEKESDKDDQNSQPSLPKYKLKIRNSLDSPPSSRPWNLDTSYPWTNPLPELNVTLPEQSKDSPQNENKLPRFKLKIHRASLSTKGLTKLTKPSPLEYSTPPKTSLSSEFFRSRFSTQNPRPSITITQNNSSHTGPVATRFAVNNHGRMPSSVTPTINLVPPSPGLNLEVQSFFSDDSSQIPPRGSLRKRLSQLKAIAARASSPEEVRGADRGLLTSAMGRSRASERSDRQGEVPSEGMYHLKHMRWRVVEKIKDWFYRGEKMVHWRGKKKTARDHPSNTNLCKGT